MFSIFFFISLENNFQNYSMLVDKNHDLTLTNNLSDLHMNSSMIFFSILPLILIYAYSNEFVLLSTWVALYAFIDLYQCQLITLYASNLT